MESCTQEKCNLQKKKCIFSCVYHGGNGDHGGNGKTIGNTRHAKLRNLMQPASEDHARSTRAPLSHPSHQRSQGSGPFSFPWGAFKAPQTPAEPTGPGGQGQRGGRRTQNFGDFCVWKPIGNSRLAELRNLMQPASQDHASSPRLRAILVPLRRLYIRHPRGQRSHWGRGVWASGAAKEPGILTTFGDGNP